MTSIFGIVVTFVLIASGMTIDYVKWSDELDTLQSAADAAALAAAHEYKKPDVSLQALTAPASLYAARNLGDLTPASALAVASNAEVKSVTVTIRMNAARAFSSLFSHTTVTLSAKATAVRGEGRDNTTPVCLFATDPAASNAFREVGGTTVKGNACALQVNSTSTSATTLSGLAKLDTSYNCLVGGVSQGLTSISPPPDFRCQPMKDPFLSIRLPDTTGACNFTDFTLFANATLSPGVYCGNLTLKNKTFTLKPGLYIIRNGAFILSGSPTVTGNGVTFLLTGTNAGVNWSSTSIIRLTAMTTGPLAGFVVFVDPNTPGAAPASTMIGSGTAYLEGGLYFAQQAVTIYGTPSASVMSPFTAIAARTLALAGGGSVTVSIDRSRTTVPVPTGFLPQAPVIRLVR